MARGLVVDSRATSTHDAPLMLVYVVMAAADDRSCTVAARSCARAETTGDLSLRMPPRPPPDRPVLAGRAQAFVTRPPTSTTAQKLATCRP
ncbi:MAG: hypothetical protein M3460_19265 [Actinomycetota bacterium]|nr:hypothetical protein [Actinomycetota bacterium]